MIIRLLVSISILFCVGLELSAYQRRTHRKIQKVTLAKKQQIKKALTRKAKRRITGRQYLMSLALRRASAKRRKRFVKQVRRVVRPRANAARTVRVCPNRTCPVVSVTRPTVHTIQTMPLHPAVVAPSAAQRSVAGFCTICQSDINAGARNGQAPRSLACAHLFHEECFQNYENARDPYAFYAAPLSCPNCRAVV